ncbi:ORF046 [Staphylococcus phage 66]|uniref:ORF046 n=1 Tax=Staphylococcus phage 66 TaxID=320832 RepID=Q4ZE49_9CAUD|nr:ORF046 [Staphylococcus phage 66]AAX90675.1 ORF046 [Staphylococcus phage 66]
MVHYSLRLKTNHRQILLQQHQCDQYHMLLLVSMVVY